MIDILCSTYQVPTKHLVSSHGNSYTLFEENALRPHTLEQQGFCVAIGVIRDQNEHDQNEDGEDEKLEGDPSRSLRLVDC